MALSYVETNGDGVTTNFAVPFSYIDRSHVHVFISDVETLSFTWVNSATIQITPAPPSGTANVLIQRTTPRNAALVDYNNGSVLFDVDLDTGNLQALFIAQEYFEQTESSFPSGHTLDSHTDATPGESVAKGALRVYDYQSKTRAVLMTDGSLLMGDTADNRGVSVLAPGTSQQILEISGGKPTWVTNLFRTFIALLTTAGDMFYATGAGVAARLGLGSAGYVLSAGASAPTWEARGFLTGDGKFTWRTTADAGWVLANDGTIGDATSGATNRANADCLDLYTLLYGYADALAPVIGGRGANAAADWAAHKPIRLLRVAGRALAGLGAAISLDAGTHAEVSTGTDTLTVPTNVNKWITGMPIVITYTGTLTGTGISSGAVLYVIRNSATTIKLATTLANAQNGTAINITAASSLAWTITYTDPNTHVGGAHEGEHAHAQSSTELLAHTHGYTTRTGGTGDNLGSGQTWTDTTTTSSQSTGGNAAMNIVPPTSYWTIQVKL